MNATGGRASERGDVLKLTAYFGERSRANGRLLADELMDMYTRHRVRASVLFRGIQGFGAGHLLYSDRLLTLSEDLPLAAVAVDVAERVHVLAEEMSTLGIGGLVTLERARSIAAPASHGADAGEAKLTIYLGRHERIGRVPGFVATCAALREHGVAGATVLLGVDGTIHGERRRACFFARNVGVPMAIVSVGPAQPIAASLGTLSALLPRSPLTLERVVVCKRDGVLLSPPHQPSSAATTGVRQKLTIVVSEAARHERRPVYLELVRRLRAAGAAGATSLRGIWGFHGDHAPHGDRLLSLRRHVPVLTIAIDTPERIAALFEIVDELTRERGLVTSELLPADTGTAHLAAAL